MREQMVNGGSFCAAVCHVETNALDGLGLALRQVQDLALEVALQAAPFRNYLIRRETHGDGCNAADQKEIESPG
jgi:hypothetical protein